MGSYLSCSVPRPSAQVFSNGEVHDWYRMVWGYSDHLVSEILHRFDLGNTDRVLDPFCGAGTTLVECLKQDIAVDGIDANPAAVFAARVKTNWSLKDERLLDLLGQLRRTRGRFEASTKTYVDDRSRIYLETAGLIRRGWISQKPLRRALALKRAINALDTPSAYRNALFLALLNEVVNGASNIRFGPELYCTKRKRDHDVFAGFSNRVEGMAQDLRMLNYFKGERVRESQRQSARGRRRVAARSERAKVFHGDARDVTRALGRMSGRQYTAVICSPPYPAEHDYTRNSRLELAFLEEVTDIESLRVHKRAMIRSHTKNIYREDCDFAVVAGISEIATLCGRIEEAVSAHNDGFARLYSTVVRNYFGGMSLHFSSLRRQLLKGARCAYVVGDQRYAGIDVPTASILAIVASAVGFKVDGAEEWRVKRSSTRGPQTKEHILLLRA